MYLQLLPYIHKTPAQDKLVYLLFPEHIIHILSTFRVLPKPFPSVLSTSPLPFLKMQLKCYLFEEAFPTISLSKDPHIFISSWNTPFPVLIWQGLSEQPCGLYFILHHSLLYYTYFIPSSQGQGSGLLSIFIPRN